MERYLLPRNLQLPVFPWDLLLPYKQQALRHVDGLVDLSVGTPVDDTPIKIQETLESASNAPGYPTVLGTVSLRESIVDWAQRRRGITCLDTQMCFPSVGSKEFVANLAWQLGVKPGDKVLFPEVAYPTYDICARLAGAEPVPVSNDIDTWDTGAALVWINTPANPHGWVADVEWLRRVVAWGRKHGAIIVSDECYGELNWEAPWDNEPIPSLLSESVCGGDPSGLLVCYSLSKQSNLAGYRAAFCMGDRALVAHLVELRKHSGYIVPFPVQKAMEVALADDEHVAKQRAVYLRRRQVLKSALESVGLQIDADSKAGLYLWVKSSSDLWLRLDKPEEVFGETFTSAPAWKLVAKFAELGILVAPGTFYGTKSSEYVRVALTGTDEEINSAACRIRECWSK